MDDVLENEVLYYCYYYYSDDALAHRQNSSSSSRFHSVSLSPLSDDVVVVVKMKVNGADDDASNQTDV